MTGCQAFVGSFGRSGMRDLDFGRHVVDCLQQLDWPAGVVVESLPCSGALMLDRFQELRPSKVVLLGAVARGEDPGAVRRFRLGEMVAADLDHSLAFARQWGGLPADTVVIEVEPAEVELGLGFSDALIDCFDPVIGLVREELAGLPEEAPPPVPEPDRWAEDGGKMADIVSYARDHKRARRSRSSPATVEGVAMAGRVRPWGVFTDSGGDWFDAVPLDGDRLGIVVGDVPGRGVEMAVAMSELRAAVQAYAVVEGDSPARVVGHLDRLAAAKGVGRHARLLYAVLEPAGVVRFVNAGGCPPLLLEPVTGGRFVDEAMSVPIGEAAAGGDRPEATLDLGLRSTLLLYTGGLVESRRVPRAIGMERLRQVATDAPFALDAFCDRVLSACTETLRRDDDICLLALRP